jgi:hypothetical protein
MTSRSLHARVRLLAKLIDELQMHIGMLKIIADNSDAINESTFGMFFRILQMDITNLSIIATTKIFEYYKRKEQYSIPSIKRALRTEICPNLGTLRFELNRGPAYFRPPTGMREDELTEFILQRLDKFMSGRGLITD